MKDAYGTQRRTMISTDKQSRKERPIARGFLDYFPDAIAEVAHVSFVGNEQHNPGSEMHWDRRKSLDHADCIGRHLIDRGTLDDDGLRHSAKVAWRALALLQIELEAEQKFPPLEDKVAKGLESVFGEPAYRENFKPLTHTDTAAAREKMPSALDPCANNGIPFQPGKHCPTPLDCGDWEGCAGGAACVQEDEEVMDSHCSSPNNCKANGGCIGPTATCDGPDAEHSLVQEQGFIPIHDFDTAQERQVSVDAKLDNHYAGAIKSQAELQAALEVAMPEPELPRIYVAGPMRGYPDFNFPAFDAARDRLLGYGWRVISPADIDRQQDLCVIQPHHVYANRDTQVIIDLARNNPTGNNSLYMLRGWEKSKGASAEHALAKWLELQIVYQEIAEYPGTNDQRPL